MVRRQTGQGNCVPRFGRDGKDKDRLWRRPRKLHVRAICERLTGERQEGYTSAAMQWGTDIEPQARAAYAFHMDADVAKLGLSTTRHIKMFGASPDGLVGETGLVETSAPQRRHPYRHALSETVPGKYITQMQVQMAPHRSGMVRLCFFRSAPARRSSTVGQTGSARR